MIWYVRRGEREIGPLGEDALRALVGTGQITPDTQLWREGLSGWTAAFTLPGVLGPRAAAPLTPVSGSPAVAADSAQAAPASSEAGAAPFEPARPWRRYWARSLDIVICLPLAASLLGAVWPGLGARLGALTGQRWVLLLAELPFGLALEALFYGALGNSPGKAIAGIKVLQEGGRRPLRAPAYLGRNFGVYVFGLGLGVPLISLFTLLYGYRRAAANETSLWDRVSGSRVYALSGAEARIWVAAGLYLLAVAVLIALGVRTQHLKSTYTATRTPAVILQQELAEAANRVNASTPRMIDKITRLDGARAGPGSLFTYEYTLTSIRLRLLSRTALETLRWRLSAHIRRAACTGTALQPMLRAGVIIRFRYRDLDARELALVPVSSADCAQ